jgi:hypothetical protein
MAIDREMPLKEQMKFDIRAQEVDIMEGDPQLDADGGATIDFGSPQPMMGGHNENLAENMNDGDLEMIARELSDAYEGDKESRGDWSSTYAEGLELLGMQYEDRTNPFPGASGVSHPLLAESVTQFQAQSYKELFPAGGPVKTQIMGAISPQVEQQSQRVKEFMNFQLTHVMEEYEPELDQMLFHLPLSGSAFRKIYFDNTLGRPVSKFVSSEDLVVPYEATDLHTCSRITHVVKMMSNDLRKFQVSGFYRDIPVYTLLEMHVDLDLPGYEDANEAGEETGIRLPYIVTIEENSNQILSIRRNWNETDPLKIKKQYFVHYKFLPGLGFYGFGLIHMLGGLTKTATSVLRQLIDAGTLVNLPAGFKARGLRIRDDDQPLVPGEFRDVDAPAGDLRASLMTLPYKEPSGTLFNLLGFVIDSGKSFAAVADMKLGEGNEVNPVGTTMALLERGMKVMSAIHKRMHAAQGKEFKLLAKLFAESLPPVYPYQIVGGNQAIKAQDFDARIDVIPVSDPNIFSVTQRVTLAQQQLQLAQAAPQMHNIYEAYRRMYEAMGVQNIDAILMQPPQPQPKDPATENSEILAGMPAQAFPGQNHDAHIEAHFSMMHSTVVKSSPIVMANLQAHIMQHISLKAQEEIQQEVMAQMQQLPPEQQQMMQQQMMMEMQSRVAERESELIAEFVAEYEELLKESTGDPLLDFKREELDVKQQDMMRKAEEASERLGFEKKKARDKKATDRAKIDQQKDAIALRSAIATEKLEKDSINKVMDKAEKITSNMDKITSNVMKPNGGL